MGGLILQRHLLKKNLLIKGHLLEARQLSDNAGLDDQNFQPEFSRLQDWVEYHMVMSRFSHRHWYMNAAPIKGMKNLTHMEQGTCLSKKVRLKASVHRYQSNMR